MSETLLGDLPQIIAGHIGTAMPALEECRGIAGRFNLDALRKTGIRAPAVLVSILGARQGDGRSGPHAHFALDMAAYVVTTDRARLARDVAAANIAQQLMRIVPDRTWAQPFVGEARDLRLAVLVNSSVAKVSASLLAVTWTQPCVLEPLPPQSEITPDIYLGLAPDIGADHEDDYTRIGETT